MKKPHARRREPYMWWLGLCPNGLELSGPAKLLST